MQSNRALVKYKHDIIGKLKDIGSVIGALDDNKECPIRYFTPFSSVHIDLIRMVTTSRETIRTLFPFQSVLNVVRELPSKDTLKMLNLGGVEVHFEKLEDGWNGYYVANTEDELQIAFNLGKLTSLLQTTEIVFQLGDLEKKLHKVI